MEAKKVRIDNENYEELKRRAALHGRSLRNYVNRVLDYHLRYQDGKALEKW